VQVYIATVPYSQKIKALKHQLYEVSLCDSWPAYELNILLAIEINRNFFARAPIDLKLYFVQTWVYLKGLGLSRPNLSAISIVNKNAICPPTIHPLPIFSPEADLSHSVTLLSDSSCGEGNLFHDTLDYASGTATDRTSAVTNSIAGSSAYSPNTHCTKRS